MPDRLTKEEKEKLVRIADGVYVEKDVLNIAQKIRDYDPNLRLKFCDPSQASISDAPYMITEVCPDGLERVVMRIFELDDRVLERLSACDNVKNNVLVSIDGHNNLLELESQRRFKEERDEAADILTHVFKSPKGRYSVKDPKTEKTIHFDDQPGIPAKVTGG